MHETNPNFKVGNSIKVKEGINDLNTNVDLSGWHGRILKVEEGETGRPLLLVAWDSHTIRSMPQSYLEQSEVEGMDLYGIIFECRWVHKSGKPNVSFSSRYLSQASNASHSLLAPDKTFWMGGGRVPQKARS